MSYKMVDEGERRAAIGPVGQLPPQLKRTLAPNHNFQPVPTPGPHDWLANQPEPGQTFFEFMRSVLHKPDDQRDTLYLQPLGEFAENKSTLLRKLQHFATSFFALKVKVLPPLDITTGQITQRRNTYTKNIQLVTVEAHWLHHRLLNITK